MPERFAAKDTSVEEQRRAALALINTREGREKVEAELAKARIGVLQYPVDADAEDSDEEQVSHLTFDLTFDLT